MYKKKSFLLKQMETEQENISLSTFVLFTPGNILITSRLFVLELGALFQSKSLRSWLFWYVTMTEQRVSYFPNGPWQPSQQACQTPGEEAQVNDPRQTSPR